MAIPFRPRQNRGMSRRPCPNCGKLFSSEADSCPHCGTAGPLPESEFIVRGVLALGCFLMVCLLAFIGFAAYYITH